MTLIFSCPAYSQCVKNTIKPISGVPLLIPFTQGNTNNDKTYENIDPFLDLDLSSQNSLSSCAFKNNAARVINIDPTNGSIKLQEGLAQTDPVTTGANATIRGICTFTPNGDQLYFPGNGPKEFGFDRIYPYKTSPTLQRIQENNKNDFFIPSDFTTSVTVTPNGKYLIYLQGNSIKNNLASIQSVDIKTNTTLGEFSRGQAPAKALEAGSYLEFANGSDPSFQYSYGIFSNLQQGKSGSGTGFAIFTTDQQTGTNAILAEFKKDTKDFTLPEIFTRQTFGGFSGFKLVQRDFELFLFISYFENDPNAGFPDFNYVTKLAIFKISTNPTSRATTISLVGRPLSTVFKSCNSSKYHGISGPIQILDDKLYIADSKNENYLASYSINWDSISTNSGGLLRLSSTPIQTTANGQERNTDIVLNSNNKFAYIATSDIKDSSKSKVTGFTIESVNINCSTLDAELASNGICEIDQDIKLSLDDTSTTEDKPNQKSQNPTKGNPEKPASNQVPNQPTNQAVNRPANTNQQPTLNLNQNPTSQASNTQQQFQQSQGSSANFGRPQNAFGSDGAFGSSQPSSFNQYPSSNKSGKMTKPVKLSTSKTSRLAQNNSGVELPNIEITQSDLKPSFKNKDKNTLAQDVQEEDQIIITPYISRFIFSFLGTESEKPKAKQKSKVINTSSGQVSNTLTVRTLPDGMLIIEKLQVGKISTSSGFIATTEAEQQEDDLPILPPASQSTKINGLVKGSNTALLLNIKQGIKIKQKDLKNISYSIINNGNKSIPIVEETILTGSNKLLVKLAIPESTQTGEIIFIAALSKKGNKKETISKSRFTIVDSFTFENIDSQSKSELPQISTIKARVCGASIHGGKIVRLTITGNNFASRLITINGQRFISGSNNSHSHITFLDTSENNIQALRTRVLNKGTKMLITLRFNGNDLENIPFIISTPKGHLFKDKTGLKLFSNSPIKNVGFNQQVEKKSTKK